MSHKEHMYSMHTLLHTHTHCYTHRPVIGLLFLRLTGVIFLLGKADSPNGTAGDLLP